MAEGQQPARVRAENLGALLDALRALDYDVIGPTRRDQAVVYDRIRSIADLPAGWTDEQDGGMYRLKRRQDGALFGYVCGQHSWKEWLHLPVLTLWQADRQDHSVESAAAAPPPGKMAFLGVRSCELHAIAIQDKVLLKGPYVDPHYRARREGLFLIAVNCTEPHGTCFCASMSTGPKCTGGFDLALTELLDGEHRFVVDVGSAAGAEVLARIPHEAVPAADLDLVEKKMAEACRHMGREVDVHALPQELYRNLEHPRWDEVANRCLTCGNCTLVCPTCFCTTMEDTTDVSGRHAERCRKWDSCFTLDFSHIYGGSIRTTPRSRYRQWLTHKLATWIDQFGTSGCVGCGRCITWCPVGIDITEEATVLQAHPGAKGKAGGDAK